MIFYQDEEDGLAVVMSRPGMTGEKMCSRPVTTTSPKINIVGNIFGEKFNKIVKVDSVIKLQCEVYDPTEVNNAEMIQMTVNNCE